MERTALIAVGVVAVASLIQALALVAVTMAATRIGRRTGRLLEVAGEAGGRSALRHSAAVMMEAAEATQIARRVVERTISASTKARASTVETASSVRRNVAWLAPGAAVALALWRARRGELPARR